MIDRLNYQQRGGKKPGGTDARNRFNFESLVAERTAISLRRNGPSVFYHVICLLLFLSSGTVMQVPVGIIRNRAILTTYTLYLQ